MEYLSGGSLTNMLKKISETNGKMRDKDASEIIKSILEAVAYLHNLDTAHRDLKPGIVSSSLIDNIMFKKQNDISSLKLIDFGLCAKYGDNQATILTDRCGTVIYMAPEVFNNYQYSKVLPLFKH
jgi:serine/threonine protein kinase